MDVRVVGIELPGRTCADPRPDGLVYENVHVGLQRGGDVVETIPGDASTAVWDFAVDRVTRGGTFDFRGPFVQGRRGDRFLYLSWGTVDAGGNFEMFRRAKLMLDAVSDELMQSADRPGRRLVGTLGLTHGDGMPRCAAVRPPTITWTVDSPEPAPFPGRRLSS